MCNNVSRCRGWQRQACQMLLAVLGLAWMQATMTLAVVAQCNSSLGCRWKARRQQGQGALPAAHRRKVGDRDGFRVLGYFTPLPLPFCVMTICFILIYNTFYPPFYGRGVNTFPSHNQFLTLRISDKTSILGFSSASKSNNQVAILIPLDANEYGFLGP